MAIGEHSIDSSISVCVALACCSRAKWINQRPEERAASIQFDPIRSDPPGRNRAEPRWMCSSQLLCFGSLLRSALFCFVSARLIVGRQQFKWIPDPVPRKSCKISPDQHDSRQSIQSNPVQFSDFHCYRLGHCNRLRRQLRERPTCPRASASSNPQIRTHLPFGGTAFASSLGSQ